MAVKKHQQIKAPRFLILNGVFAVGSSSRTWKTFPNPNFIEMGYVFYELAFFEEIPVAKCSPRSAFNSVLKLCVLTQDWLLSSELLRGAQPPNHSPLPMGWKGIMG